MSMFVSQDVVFVGVCITNAREGRSTKKLLDFVSLTYIIAESNMHKVANVRNRHYKKKNLHENIPILASNRKRDYSQGVSTIFYKT